MSIIERGDLSCPSTLMVLQQNENSLNNHLTKIRTMQFKIQCKTCPQAQNDQIMSRFKTPLNPQRSPKPYYNNDIQNLTYPENPGMRKIHSEKKCPKTFKNVQKRKKSDSIPLNLPKIIRNFHQKIPSHSRFTDNLSQ